jgi:hypothetical protein
LSDGQLFTFDLISELLFQAGFVDVVERCYRRRASRFPEIAELDNREDESFFVEASGPADASRRWAILGAQRLG